MDKTKTHSKPQFVNQFYVIEFPPLATWCFAGYTAISEAAPGSAKQQAQQLSETQLPQSRSFRSPEKQPPTTRKRRTNRRACPFRVGQIRDCRKLGPSKNGRGPKKFGPSNRLQGLAPLAPDSNCLPANSPSSRLGAPQHQRGRGLLDLPHLHILESPEVQCKRCGGFFRGPRELLRAVKCPISHFHRLRTGEKGGVGCENWRGLESGNRMF